jgi:hypothetical protein
MNAATYIIEEFRDQIKRDLIEQNVRRLLDYHLGNYQLEEGEILEPWNLEELDKYVSVEDTCTWTRGYVEDTRGYVEDTRGYVEDTAAEVVIDIMDNDIIYMHYGYDEEPIEIVIQN